MTIQALNRIAQKHSPGPPRWTIGQKVWLNMKNLALPYGTIKLVPRRHGPFEVEKVMSPVVYRLRLPPQWNIHPVFHASLLTPYAETKEHGENYTRPPPDMIEGEAEYEVEAIRAHRYQRRKLQYLIKWKGYPESDNTWEPLDNVCAPQLIKKYHATHPLEDKRVTVQARTISPISQPTQLLGTTVTTALPPTTPTKVFPRHRTLFRPIQTPPYAMPYDDETGHSYFESDEDAEQWNSLYAPEAFWYDTPACPGKTATPAGGHPPAPGPANATHTPPPHTRKSRRLRKLPPVHSLLIPTRRHAKPRLPSATSMQEHQPKKGVVSPPLRTLPSPPPLPSSPSSPTSREQPPPTAWEQWANDWAKEMCVRRIARDLERLTLQYPVEPATQATPRDADDS